MYSQPSQVHMVVRMHIQRVQFMNHLDMLKKEERKELMQRRLCTSLLSYLLRLLGNVQMFSDVT